MKGRKHSISVTALSLWILGAGSTLGCGSSGGADPYNGYIDATALEAKFLPSTDKTLCPPLGTPPCYPVQQGYAQGVSVTFYNLGAVAAMQIAAASVTTHGYRFDGCNPGPAFVALHDAYPVDKQQFPIIDALPLAAQAGAGKPPVLPLVAVHNVKTSGGNVCNDLKTADSVAGSSPKFGATIDPTTEYRLWAVIDTTTARIAPLQMGQPVPIGPAWYRTLQLGFLDGGAIPTDPAGANLIAMEGALLDPTPGVTSRTTDAKAIVLGARYGMPGYSPIVRLHEFVLPAGKHLGDYTAICATGGACADNEVDLSQSKLTGTLLFIVGGGS